MRSLYRHPRVVPRERRCAAANQCMHAYLGTLSRVPLVQRVYALHEVGRVLIPVMHDWHALEIAREMRFNNQRRKCGFLPCFGSNRERHLATSPGRP